MSDVIPTHLHSRLPVNIFLAIGVCSLLATGCGKTGEAPTTHPGKDTYIKYCAACHNAGVAEAPKLGDAKAWSHRLKKGKETLVQNTVTGMPPGMPVKGLCMSCTEAELSDAVDYMLVALE